MSLIKCRECGKKVSKKAKLCPGCGSPVKAKPASGCGAIFIMAIFVAAFVIYLQENHVAAKSTPQSAPAHCPDKTMAWVIITEVVKSRLKSPATASFPGLFDGFSARRSVRDHGNGLYSVSSWVDAQNSYGAKLRTHYTAEIQWTGGDPASSGNWKMTRISFGSQ